MTETSLAEVQRLRQERDQLAARVAELEKALAIAPCSARGSRHPRAKLTEAQAQEIQQRYRAGGVTYEALAFEYAVSPALIGHIVQGRKWRHVRDAREDVA